MKRKILGLLLATSLVFTAGCAGKNTSNNTASTEIDANVSDSIVANELYASFNELANAEGATAEGVATKLSENSVFGEIAMGTMDVSEGLLNGFDGEVKGFSKGTMFSPMIGSMPFVGYVFETDNADALIDTLKAQHNLGWNICTQADAFVTGKAGNLVFIVMAPNSFDQ